MTDALRVRHLLKGLGPGGAERLVVAQVTAPGTAAHVVTYLVPAKDHMVPLLTSAGIETTCLEAPTIARPGWILRLRRLLRADRTDVLHVHSPAVASVARLVVRTLPRDTRPVIVSTEHNRWPRHHRLTRLANRMTIRGDQAVIAVSADVKSTITAVPADRIRVIVHGIDTAAIRAAADRGAVRSELGVADDEIVLLCVANLRREKSLDVLIAAARLALATEPRLRYFLIGQGPLGDDVDHWIAEAGVGERFTALGYRDDAPRVMSGADVFTLSSSHEGLPVAIMEALTSGLPIAATDAGGTAEAVGTAGIISPVGDAAALAAGHCRLASDAVLRSELADAARREADRFSISRAVAEIEEVYAVAMTFASDRPSSHS